MAQKSFERTLRFMMSDRNGAELRATKTLPMGTCMLFSTADRACRTLACIAAERKPGVAVPRQLKQLVKKNRAHNCIIVSDQAVTHGAAKECTKHGWQCFTFQELSFPVARHSLVPRHRLLSQDEETSLLQRLHIRKAQLPIINSSDPVCRYYDFRPGSVLEILRRNGYQVPTLYYRLVVP